MSFIYNLIGDPRAQPTFKAAQLPHKLIGSDIVTQKVREGSSISSLVEVEGELCCVCLSRLKKGQKIWEERRNVIHSAALHMKNK